MYKRESSASRESLTLHTVSTDTTLLPNVAADLVVGVNELNSNVKSLSLRLSATETIVSQVPLEAHLNPSSAVEIVNENRHETRTSAVKDSNANAENGEERANLIEATYHVERERVELSRARDVFKGPIGVHPNSEKHNEEEEDILRNQSQLGKLSWIQKTRLKIFNDIRFFTFCISIMVMLTNALTVGYRNSVMTTIEKRFEFSSVFSGLLSGWLEIGSLITTLFVSYFCTKSHIPKCIAISSFCCALGAFFYALPHFLSGSYTLHSNVFNKSLDDSLCKKQADLSQSRLSPIVPQKHSDMADLIPFLSIDPKCQLKPNNYGNFFALILANLLIGCSSAPLYTLGTTYIDTHVSKENASIYLAFMYSMLAFGPVVGYLTGAISLQVYVDSLSFDVNQLKLSPDHSNWVGAWFAGFLIFGIFILICSFPFLFFPKVIFNKYVRSRRNETEKGTAKKLIESTFGNLKTLPKSIKNIFMNKVFMIITVAYCFEINIISGFMTFLPKYIEHQFSVGNSLANIYTGGIAIPGACVGIVAGGFIVKRFKIDTKGAATMAISCNILCLLGIFILIALGCPNIRMAGTTTSYLADHNKLGIELKKVEITEYNLLSKCNKNCQCSTSYIEPICGKNGITYFSPCFAGCKEYEVDEEVLLPGQTLKKNYYKSCDCISEDLISNFSTRSNNEKFKSSKYVAESGLCSFNCRTLVPFLFFLFLITLLTALNQMPMLMVTLRSVSEIERPFALGVQLVLMRLLAYIPSPLIFGKAIEWTCLVWRRNECNQVGSCLFYDREKFRYYYGSIAAFYKAISLLLFTYLLIYVRKLLKSKQIS